LNFLAHLLLSGPDSALMTGNLIADMVHMPDISNLPDMLVKGVAIHRSIDTFTDTHPLVHECLTFIKPTSGRYASVVLDIFFDYILANNWCRFSDTPFVDFENHVYQSLNHQLPNLPAALSPRISDMINHQWLRLYTYREGLTHVLGRFRTRVSRPHSITDAEWGYDQNYPELEVRFNLFFEEIQAYIAAEFNVDSRWTTLQSERIS
jgi:acyl carrier protein phosphodiesterase